MNTVEREYLRSQRSHDYGELMRRWKRVARSAGLREEVFHVAGGMDVVAFETGEDSGGESIYVCAGVHGDEPAGVLGLLEWAEEHVATLRSSDLLILPCFNPWGLVNNSRSDHRGKDLNRQFHSRHDPHIVHWRKYLAGRRFRLCLTLHEDYDAQGLYVYEVARTGLELGEALLRGCRNQIETDPRKNIEGLRAVNGVIRRKTRRVPDLPGLPEALVLFHEHTDHSMTFESPSEFSLFRRVGAQKAFLEGVFAMVGRLG
jgi:hypothetical protein